MSAGPETRLIHPRMPKTDFRELMEGSRDKEVEEEETLTWWVTLDPEEWN